MGSGLRVANLCGDGGGNGGGSAAVAKIDNVAEGATHAGMKVKARRSVSAIVALAVPIQSCGLSSRRRAGEKPWTKSRARRRRCRVSQFAPIRGRDERVERSQRCPSTHSPGPRARRNGESAGKAEQGNSAGNFHARSRRLGRAPLFPRSTHPPGHVERYSVLKRGLSTCR